MKIPELVPCSFCGWKPVVSMKDEVVERNIITSSNNPMYSFEIRHECGGFEQRHLTLFFKNDSTSESCKETLQTSIDLFSEIWNKRHSLIPDNKLKIEELTALRESNMDEITEVNRLLELLYEVGDEPWVKSQVAEYWGNRNMKG